MKLAIISLVMSVREQRLEGVLANMVRIAAMKGLSLVSTRLKEAVGNLDGLYWI